MAGGALNPLDRSSAGRGHPLSAVSSQGWFSGRLQVETNCGSAHQQAYRWATALLGGAIMAYGARIRACTSGQALSSAAQYCRSARGFMFFVRRRYAAMAYFVRRLWNQETIMPFPLPLETLVSKPVMF